MHGRQRDVGSVAVGGGGQKAGVENFAAQFVGGSGWFKQGNATQELQPLTGHRRLAVGNLVQHDLRSEKFVMLAFQIPPIAGELLAGGLQKVAGGARNDVARYRAFDVDAHGQSLRLPLGEEGLKRAVVERLAAGVLEPGRVVRVLHALQEFFVVLDGDDDGDRFAFARHDFGFGQYRFHVNKIRATRAKETKFRMVQAVSDRARSRSFPDRG